MRDADDGGFLHGRMAHERVFEVHGANPFAAGFHQIFRAVHDFDNAFGIDGRHIAGLEPAVFRPAMGLVGRVVIACGDPRPANLQFAGAFAVPGSFDAFSLWAIWTHHPQIHKGRRPPLLAAHFVLLLLRPIAHVPLEFAERGQWSRLRHAPQVQDVQIVFVQRAHQPHRWRRAPARDAHGPREFPASGILF